MIDRTRKREVREERRRKRHPVHGRSWQHAANAIRRRAEQKGAR